MTAETSPAPAGMRRAINLTTRIAVSISGIAAVLLLAVSVGTAVWPTHAGTEGPAEPRLLVGNLGLGGGDDNLRAFLAVRPGFAQAFSTGAEAGGYTLDSLGIRVSQIADAASAGDHLRMTVNGAADGGGPGDVLCEFAAPPSFSSPGMNTFDAPTGEAACPRLAAETTYFIVTEWTGPIVDGAPAWIPQTHSTGEDPGGAEDWSIADESWQLTVSDNARTWNLFPDDVMFIIEVRGAAEDLAADTPVNSPAAGAPTISGTAQAGETLVASAGDISDADGLENVSYAYQWVRSDGNTDTVIAGETDSSYGVSDDDVGKTIKVRVSFTDDAENEESLTSDPTGPVVDRPNRSATGLPTITGVAQVGLALMAETGLIADPDGMENAVFVYQWLRDGNDIAGAASASYTLVSDDEEAIISLRVSFTDNRGHAETLTSAATAAVRPPLTASFENTPSSHDGQTGITFKLRFSEDFGLSYLTLKNEGAFTVTGGNITKAQRLDKPTNILWRITVEPASNGTVTIVLPATTDCNDHGAICTDDGRMLSNRLTLAVSGPGG